MRLENFRVDPTNRLAFLAIQALAAGKEVPWRCIYIHGPKGSGKSHLMSALIQAWRAKGLGTAVSITGQEFAQGYRFAFHRGRVPQFHRMFDQARLLVLEDVSKLERAKACQREIARVCDQLVQRAGMMVFSGEAQPYRLKLEKRLQDRIGSGLVIELGKAAPSLLSCAAR